MQQVLGLHESTPVSAALPSKRSTLLRLMLLGLVVARQGRLFAFCKGRTYSYTLGETVSYTAEATYASLTLNVPLVGLHSVRNGTQVGSNDSNKLHLRPRPLYHARRHTLGA